MYCRECGNQIPDNSLRCPDCGTKSGEGISYCQNCGNLTSIKTEFCFHCGAKLKNIMTQKMKNERLAELQKKAKFNKTIMNIEKFLAVTGIVVAVVCIAVLVLRPEPNNIPDISSAFSGRTISPNANIHDSMQRVGNTYYYSSNISDEVAEYWIQGRALISYIILSVFIAFVSFVGFLIQKSAYKKIIKALKEAKNVL